MKSVAYVTVLLVSSLILFAKEENLFKNSDFSKLDSEGKPLSWWFGGNKVDVRQENGKTIVSAGKGAYGLFTQAVTLEDNKTYTLSVTMRKVGNAPFFGVCPIQRESGKPDRQLSAGRQWMISLSEDFKTYNFTFQGDARTSFFSFYRILRPAEKGSSDLIEFREISLFEGDGEIHIPILKKTPALNGKLDHEFTENALHGVDFIKFPCDDNGLVVEQTEFYLAASPDKLCLNVLLHHDPNHLLKGKVEPNDSPHIFQDDAIEFFITHTDAERPLYHFAVNVAGASYDSADDSSAYDSGIRTATGDLSPSCRLIQFEVPLEDIGYNPKLDAGLKKLRWKMNMGRIHILPDGKQVFSSWSRVNSFRDKVHFVNLDAKNGSAGRRLSACFLDGRNAASESPALKDAFWPIKNPLYSELITKEKVPFQGESAFMWKAPIDSSNVTYALQYGQEFSWDKILAEYEKYRLHPYELPNVEKRYVPKVREWVKKSGIGYVMYFPYQVKNASFIYDKSAFDSALKMAEDELKKEKGQYFAICMGDEVLSWTLRKFIQRANNQEEIKKDPYLQAAIETVRRDYGYGKYGVPKSVDNGDEPFSHIAVRRFVIDRMVDLQKEIMVICKRNQGPDGRPLIAISDDPQGGTTIHNISRIAPYCDIMTAQMTSANTYSQQRMGFLTKLLADLSGKPVWPALHVENYIGNYDSETVSAFFSEVARTGATGCQLWLYDEAGNARGTASPSHDYFGHKPRWNTIMDIVRRFQTMGRLRFPKADYAVLVSNDTALSKPLAGYHNDGLEALFNLTGPAAGTWFRYIGDTQIEDGKVNLKDWKVILVADADIENLNIQNKLQEYVENGGILISFDPSIFSFSREGSDTTTNRAELFGVDVKDGENGTKIILSEDSFWPHSAKKILTLPGNGKKYLIPQKGTKILASYANGQVAVAKKMYSKGGCAILFSFELSTLLADRSEWVLLIKDVFSALDVKTDHDIWKFSFPFIPDREPEFKNECLTGNNFFWFFSTPVIKANTKLPGAKYWYTLPPDHLKGKSRNNLEFIFGEGNLTNRLGALKTGDMHNPKNKKLIDTKKLSMDMFADTFSDPEAFDVIFDFGKEVVVSEVNLYLHGEIPEITVFAENKKLACMKETSVIDVMKGTFCFSKTRTRRLKIHFGPRVKGGKLVVSEAEIWGYQ